MQEQHRLVMRAGFGLAVAEHAGTGGLERIPRGADVIDFVEM